MWQVFSKKKCLSQYVSYAHPRLIKLITAFFFKTAFMTWYPVDSGYDSKKEKKDEHYVYSALHNLGEISAWFLKKNISCSCELKLVLFLLLSPVWSDIRSNAEKYLLKRMIGSLVCRLKCWHSEAGCWIHSLRKWIPKNTGIYK